MILFSVNTYDPEEEEGRRRPSHISRREVVIIGVVLIIAIVLLVPVYRKLRADRDGHICVENLDQIGKAMNFYALDNNDRFPPIFTTSDDNIRPRVFDGGVFTWVSLTSQYMNARSSFTCPAAEDAENVLNLNPQYTGAAGIPKSVVSSYGMYGAMAALPRGSIPNLGSSALVADSSNAGSNNTYDPLPFKGDDGKALPDGFLIGLDTSNFTLQDNTRKVFNSAKLPTRLALPDSKNGITDLTRSRHPDGIKVMMADQHLITIKAQNVAVEHLGKKNEITGFWSVPY